jgi:hypothetical protein
MKQRNKKKLPAPRATKVNEILRAKKGGSHKAKTGDRASRARQKQNARREMDA